MWLDDLQLYLLSDSRDSVSLFDHTSGASLAPLATTDSATRSQWLTLAPYSSPAIAALGRLLLPYLFPKLSAFATVEDLITHLRTSDARYRAALPAEFLDKNLPPMYITLYFIVTRLPDSLRAVRDHFLALDPTDLTVDLLEEHLLATETSVVAVGATRGTPRTPFFEGCSPSPLAPSYDSAAAVDVLGTEDVGAASASGKRRSSKGKGGRSSEGGSGVVVGAAVEVVVVVKVLAAVGVVAGVGALVAAAVAVVGVAVVAAVGVVAIGVERGASGGSVPCPYVIRTGDRAGQTCGKPHTQQRCFSRLDDACRAEFGDEAERPRWAELLRSGVAIFDLDYDAILATCLESALSGTAPAEALHTFTLDLDASRCFFRDSTTLTPLSTPVPVRLADPSGGPVLACSSTVPLAVPSSSLTGLHLPSFSMNLVSTAALQDAMVTTTTLGGQRVSICTCTRTGRHLATFTRRPGSSLYTLATEPPQVAVSTQVSMSCPIASPCSCRLLPHQTLLWHHRLGHPSLPRLCGMQSRLLVSGLPRSLPPLPPSPAPPCLPCVEGRQRAAPHSSSFPPTIAPLQTLHMDVWGPTRVSGQDRERYFLLLREWFHQDLPVQCLHSDRGGEFSSDLLRDLCRGEGILLRFTLPASPQRNGIAERRIGLVMEVTRTSMIHAAAPHFLWPFAVRYVVHQLNLGPRVSLLETSPTLRWTGKVGDVSVFRVWGSRAFVRDTSADKLSAHAIPSVFLGFPPNAPGWQFYHPTLRRVLPSKGPAPSGVSQVDPLPGIVPTEVAVDSGAASGGATSGGVASGGAELARAEPRGAEPTGAEPGGTEFEGAGSGGAEPGGAEPGGTEPAGAEPWGAATEGAEPGGAESEGVESGCAEPRGTASSGGRAGASPRLSPRPEPLSPQQLCEWFARRTRLWTGAAKAGDSVTGGTGAGCAGATSLCCAKAL
ncbi:unnamed protein product [Closterium sp. NIES-54]